MPLTLIPIRKTNLELASDIAEAGGNPAALRDGLDTAELTAAEYLNRYREGLKALAEEAGVSLYRTREVFR